MDFKGKVCPVCSNEFKDEDDIVVCPKCGAPYHRECYAVNGKCIFPDLHKSKQSWKEVCDKSENNYTENDYTENDTDTVICPKCGEKNDKNSPVCRNCNKILDEKKTIKIHFDPDGDNTELEEKLKELSEEHPFIILADPMGGVPKNEDFNGVSGAELAKLVKTNTAYYMPTFHKIKNAMGNRFHFPAFVLTGSWYVYRKQYLKGALISLLYFFMFISRYIITVNYAMPIFQQIKNVLTESGLSEPSTRDILSWAFRNSPQTDLCLIVIPYLLSIFIFALHLICGFTANKSYYKHSLKKIKKLKKHNNSENIMKTIAQNGGVNTPLAWSSIICYIIANFFFS